MTKFANTPEGRAAANASMAATGTTMRPRPSGPKAATSIKAPNATQASPRRRMAGDPPRSRPTMPAGAGRSGSKNPSAPPQASSQYSPPGNMSPALRQKLQARNAAGAKGRYGGADRMVRPGVVGGPPSVSAPQAPAKSGSIYGSRAADMASGRGPGRVGRGMRGGGLARKGVGMALAKGGLARRAGGCAKRGVGKGKIL